MDEFEAYKAKREAEMAEEKKKAEAKCVEEEKARHQVITGHFLGLLGGTFWRSQYPLLSEVDVLTINIPNFLCHPFEDLRGLRG